MQPGVGKQRTRKESKLKKLNAKCQWEIEVMCASVSSCVAVPPGIGLSRQNVAGRQSGRVSERIKTHTHTLTQPACWPGSSHTEISLWVPASRPHLLYAHTGKEQEEGGSKGTERGV